MDPVLRGGGLSRPALSLVVPVCNEEHRLTHLLRALDEGWGAAPLTGRAGVGRAAGTPDPPPPGLRPAAPPDPRVVPVITGGPNEGKGAATAAGVRHARGELTLLCDVDVSTPLAEVAVLQAALSNGADVAIGSRDMPESDIRAPQHRQRIGRVFAALVRGLTGMPFRDTQCGFKLMPTETAVALHREQRVKGFASDVELLLRARALGLSVAEVPVRYFHDGDSKVNPLVDAPRMGADVVRLAWRQRR